MEIDTTEVSVGFSQDSTALRYSVPLKQFIATQQETIKDLNAKLEESEVKLENCRTEVTDLTAKASSNNCTIYGFLSSTNGLIIAILLIICFIFFARKSKISFKNLSITPMNTETKKAEDEKHEESK